MNKKFLIGILIMIIATVSISGCIGEDKVTVEFGEVSFDLINGFTDKNFSSDSYAWFTDNKTNGSIMNTTDDTQIIAMSQNSVDFMNKHGYTTYVNEVKDFGDTQAYYWVYSSGNNTEKITMSIKYKLPNKKSFYMYIYTTKADYEDKEYGKKLNETVENIIKTTKTK